MSLETAVLVAAINGDKLAPKLSESINYKHWLSIEEMRRCLLCAENHGKIYLMEEIAEPRTPLHRNCRCYLEKMITIDAGTATVNGTEGADWTLKYDGKLPNYYVTKKYANEKGWKAGKWLSDFVPTVMMTGGIYRNDDKHLPQKNGRIWYEADINYKSGKRNKQRVVWSNDGLIFVTYDHYKTFYEIV